MRKSLFIACLLGLCGAFVGCVNDTRAPDERAPVVTAAGGAEVPGLDVRIDPGEPIDAHLARLQALELFEVGELVRYRPGERYSCAYNLPCPGEEADQALEAQHARLLGLLAIAEDVRTAEGLPSAAMESASQHLSALQALSIVQVGELIVDQPANSAECYGLPCPGDEEEARLRNERRAAEVAALAERTRDL